MNAALLGQLGLTDERHEGDAAELATELIHAAKTGRYPRDGGLDRQTPRFRLHLPAAVRAVAFAESRNAKRVEGAVDALVRMIAVRR